MTEQGELTDAERLALAGLRRTLEATLAAGITGIADVALFNAITIDPGQTIGHYAKLVGMGQSEASRAVKNLDAAQTLDGEGLVHRLTLPHDERSKRVFLAPGGVKLRDVMIAHMGSARRPTE